MEEMTSQQTIPASSWAPELGASCDQAKGTAFRVWAPKAKSIDVVLIGGGDETILPMRLGESDVFELVLPALTQPVDYIYLIDGEKRRPDPRSRWQPKGVHGPSRLCNPQEYAWCDHGWKGIPLPDYILYELHVGTFTSEGTFDAAIKKIPHLKDLGITAIELMPAVEFPGERNWGYDGVFPYAPHHNYGGPDGLKRLIDACHQAGIAVVIDAVYNHLGPEGNYLGDFGYYFTDHYKTPWGQAVNYDGPYSDHVRRYFIDNTLFWLAEYHADAIRLDAIHAIFDFSARHILEELHEEFHKLAESAGRQAYIIAESDLNDVRIINSREKGGYALDAQWNDDWHHALFALLTKCNKGYFADFSSLAQLAKAMQDGFVYEGQYSRYRKKKFGSRSTGLPGEKFVVCIENHDQIGNAAQGKRLGSLVDEEEYRLASALLFCAPNIPLLFMGQEWRSMSPFYFFTSFEDETLAKNVTEGYIREFGLEGADAAEVDPQNPQRFVQSKLHWEEAKMPGHNSMLAFYKKLIRLRKELPCLGNCQKDLTKVDFREDQEWMVVHRADRGQSRAIIVGNFRDKTQEIPVMFPRGQWQLRLCSSASRENAGTPNALNLQEEKHIAIPVPSRTALIYAF